MKLKHNIYLKPPPHKKSKIRLYNLETQKMKSLEDIKVKYVQFLLLLVYL